MATATETYDGILAGLHEDFSPQAAKGILTLGFSTAQQERMKQLAAQARAGELSDQERVEADNFEQVSSLLRILQTRARMALKRSRS